MPVFFYLSVSFHEKDCQEVDVATLWFPDYLAFIRTLFDGCRCRCMLVSVFGAAISVTNSLLEASALLLIQDTNRSRRTRHGKTYQRVKYFMGYAAFK